MQQVSGELFLHVSPDHLVASGMLPGRRDPDGPFAWWDQMRPRFFAGFHRCLPALAAAGNDLIAGHIIEFRACGRTWRGCSKALVISSPACAATWRKSAAAGAAGDIAVSERCARCPARVRNRAGDRCRA